MTVTYQGAPVADVAARLMFRDGALSTTPILWNDPVAQALAYAHELDRTMAAGPSDEAEAAIEEIWQLDLCCADTLAEALAMGIKAVEQQCIDENPSGVWLPTWDDPGEAGLESWLSDLIDAKRDEIAETFEREARAVMARVQEGAAVLLAAE